MFRSCVRTYLIHIISDPSILYLIHPYYIWSIHIISDPHYIWSILHLCNIYFLAPLTPCKWTSFTKKYSHKIEVTYKLQPCLRLDQSETINITIKYQNTKTCLIKPVNILQSASDVPFLESSKKDHNILDFERAFKNMKDWLSEESDQPDRTNWPKFDSLVTFTRFFHNNLCSSLSIVPYYVVEPKYKKYQRSI